MLLPIRDKPDDGPWDAFPESCVAALSKILEAVPNAKIVLSSTWRATTDSVEHILSEFRRYSGEFGGPLSGIHSIDLTTSLENHSVRQWEVAEWVLGQPKLMKGTKRNLSTFAWVALDDDTSLTEDPRFMALCAPHTVQTDSRLGLTESDADAAICILRHRDSIEGEETGADRERTSKAQRGKAQKRKKDEPTTSTKGGSKRK